MTQNPAYHLACVNIFHHPFKNPAYHLACVSIFHHLFENPAYHLACVSIFHHLFQNPRMPFKLSIYFRPFFLIPNHFNFYNQPPQFISALCFPELALSQETLEESFNKGVVTALYDALKNRDADRIHKILAADLEWWFHGPPSHQFLMRVLTGDKDPEFHFVPHSISAFGSIVVAEGLDLSGSIAWIHAWTVNSDGIILQVREYFNTSLTVTRIGKAGRSDCSGDGIASLHCPSIWQSSLPDRVGKSVPGLVLAI